MHTDFQAPVTTSVPPSPGGHPLPGSQPMPTSSAYQPTAEDMQKQMHLRRLQADQNLPLGAIAGLAGAIAGSIVWALITHWTGYQIGWMAVGVGYLVGQAMRHVGKGVDKKFGLAGAGLALFGCVLGNILTACIEIAAYEGMGFFELVGSLEALSIVGILFLTFHPMDLLFYGLAVWTGYKYSFTEPS